MGSETEQILKIVALAALAVLIVYLLRKEKKKKPAPSPPGPTPKVSAQSMRNMQMARLASQGTVPMMNGQLMNSVEANLPGLTSTGAQYTISSDLDNGPMAGLQTQQYESLGANPAQLSAVRSTPVFSRQRGNPFIDPI
jgi:hypothetical protein